MIIAGKFFTSIFGALKIVIPLPLGLILAAGVWIYFDRSSAIRSALNRAVAGYELEAAKAREDGLAKILEAERQRLADVERANEAFASDLAQSELKFQDLEDEIEELVQTRDVSSDGRVDPDLAGQPTAANTSVQASGRARGSMKLFSGMTGPWAAPTSV